MLRYMLYMYTSIVERCGSYLKPVECYIVTVLCTSVFCSVLCTALLEVATVALGGRPMYLEERKGRGRGREFEVDSLTSISCVRKD